MFSSAGFHKPFSLAILYPSAINCFLRAGSGFLFQNARVSSSFRNIWRRLCSNFIPSFKPSAPIPLAVPAILFLAYKGSKFQVLS